MKIEFSSGLCDDITRYMPNELAQLQPQFDVTLIEGNGDEVERVMKERESKETERDNNIKREKKREDGHSF